MKVELNLKEGYCKITKEDGDKRITKSGYSGQTETTLLYRIKKELIKQGYAHAYTRFPFKYLDEFREYERIAREEKKGLWK